MARLNRLLGVFAVLASACGSQSSPPAEAPQGMAPAEEPTGAATPGVGAATTEAPMAPAPAPAAAPTEPAPSPAATVAPPSDAEIAMVVELANQGEVEQGKLAQTRAKNTRVKKFATMMVNDHGAAGKELQKLVTKVGIQPNESALSTQLATDSATHLSTLKEADAASFDRTYIDTQVEVHTKVLDAIDTQLLPNAKNEELRAQLTKMRGKIEHHLKEARDIQQSLAAAGTAPGGQGGANLPASNPATSKPPAKP